MDSFFVSRIDYYYKMLNGSRGLIAFFLTVLLIVIFVYKRKRTISMKGTILFIAINIYFFCVLVLTVFSRMAIYSIYDLIVFDYSGWNDIFSPSWNFRLFHSYKLLIEGNSIFVYQIVGNLILFVPIGMLLSLCDKIKLYQGILVGIAMSVTIEGLQLLLRCGTFELDDLFHNTLGLYLGWITMHTFIKR